MSVSRVVIPVLDLEQNDDPHSKVVVKGAKQLSTQKIKANGSATVSEVSFNWQPPSQNTVLDRRIDLVMKWTIDAGGDSRFLDHLLAANNSLCTSSAGAGNAFTYGLPESTAFVKNTAVYTDATARTVAVLDKATGQNVVKRYGNNIGLRQFPIHSIIDNIDLTLNGTHFSTDPVNYLKAVSQYTTPEFRERAFKNTAHHPDTFAGSYSDPFLLDRQQKYASSVNPLSRSGKGRLGETPNGNMWNDQDAGGVLTVDATTGTDRKVIITLREPLMISPLNVDFGTGMTNLNNIDVAIKFNSACNRIIGLFDASTAGIGNDATLSVANTPATAFGVVADSAFLEVRNFTAQDDIKIPNEIILPYNQPRRFETSAPTAALANNTDSATIVSSNRRLDQIPEAVYLWVEDAKSVLMNATNGHALTDGMCQPVRVDITFGNQVGILSNYSSEQLFELAVENGCDLLDMEEARRKGYCLKLVFGKDIPLADNESAGTRGDYNIQINMVAYNGGARALTQTTMKEVYINNGQVIISPNECRVQTGLLDLKDNIEAENMGHHYALNDEIAGAGLFSSLSKFAKKVPHLARGVVKHAPALVQTARALNEVRKDPSMGNIMSAGQSAMALHKGMKGGSLTGGSVSGGSMSGGSITGGGYRSRRK
tara:strand:- start:2120 stop:4081 length:1962 start_codon:yes stop_codon:yes gene_type:complete